MIIQYCLKSMQPGPVRKKNKQVDIPTYSNLTAFKEQEKHFKAYQHKDTDFSTLWEPQKFEICNGYRYAYLPYPKGAILVEAFNDSSTVLKVGLMALNTYCYKPYRTNLDSIQQLYGEKAETEDREKKKDEMEEQNSKGYSFNDRIRWANVGYQYDWTLRKYPDVKTEMPQLIEQISARANAFYNTVSQQDRKYMPQSAIINYYSEKDYMTGHLDDAQIDQISPIYSFSFGLSCIFLIGGRTKQNVPLAVKLNSGDLLIMADEARLCYHGVPRVLTATFKEALPAIHYQGGGRNTVQQVWEYYLRHRININIRQVYPRE